MVIKLWILVLKQPLSFWLQSEKLHAYLQLFSSFITVSLQVTAKSSSFQWQKQTLLCRYSSWFKTCPTKKKYEISKDNDISLYIMAHPQGAG